MTLVRGYCCHFDCLHRTQNKTFGRRKRRSITGGKKREREKGNHEGEDRVTRVTLRGIFYLSSLFVSSDDLVPFLSCLTSITLPPFLLVSPLMLLFLSVSLLTRFRSYFLRLPLGTSTQGKEITARRREENEAKTWRNRQSPPSLPRNPESIHHGILSVIPFHGFSSLSLIHWEWSEGMARTIRCKQKDTQGERGVGVTEQIFLEWRREDKTMNKKNRKEDNRRWWRNGHDGKSKEREGKGNRTFSHPISFPCSLTKNVVCIIDT